MASSNKKRKGSTFEEKNHALRLMEDDGLNPSTVSSITGVSKPAIYK